MSVPPNNHSPELHPPDPLGEPPIPPAEIELRPHQEPIFENIQASFASGDRRVYVQLPTGTGKTIIYIKTIQWILENPDWWMEANPEWTAPPSILVITPTKDLVRQTIGKSGKRGFGKFAPDLEVMPFFSDSSPQERRQFTRGRVGVTTYRSFKILQQTPDFVPANEMNAEELADVYHTKLQALEHDFDPLTATHLAQEYMKTYEGSFSGDPMLSKFHIFVPDEAHHALPGSVAAEVIQSIPDDRYIIGFTATPDAHEERQLSHILPKVVHKMSLIEAIESGILAPIVPIGVHSGLRVSLSDSTIFDAAGDFIDSRLDDIMKDPRRNELITTAAKILVRHNIPTIVSCIAGDEMWHPEHIADRLAADGITAVAVHNKVPLAQRLSIYEQFERGEIRVLTFIGILAEGWDSNAKGLVNGRLTRAPIFAEQRPGRLTRPGNVAYTIDIVDQFSGENHPITVPDVLGQGDVPFGTVFGEVTDEERARMDIVVAALAAELPVLSVLKSHYETYQAILARAPRLENGKVTLEEGKQYSLPSTINPGSFTGGVTEELLLRAAELQGVTLPSITASRPGGVLRTVFAVTEAQAVLRNLPIVDPHKYHLDSSRNKWAAPLGLVALFSKQYPKVTQKIIEDILYENNETLEWIPARFRVSSYHKGSFSRYRIAKLYPVTRNTIQALSAMLTQHFSEE